MVAAEEALEHRKMLSCVHVFGKMSWLWLMLRLVEDMIEAAAEKERKWCEMGSGRTKVDQGWEGWDRRGEVGGGGKTVFYIDQKVLCDCE